MEYFGRERDELITLYSDINFYNTLRNQMIFIIISINVKYLG